MTIFPLLYLVYMGMLDWTLVSREPARFVGIQNYVDIFLHEPIFYRSMGITFGYAAAVTAIELILGTAIALLISRDNIVARFVRLIIIIPLMMTPFLVNITWKYLYMPGLGPVAYVLDLLGNPNPRMFSTVPSVYLALAVIDIWQWMPFAILVVLAGLSALPRTTYEAAEVDGASSWQKFRYLTIPFLRPIFAIVVLFRFIDSLKVFDSIYALTGGGPGTATWSMSWQIFFSGLGNNLDMGLSAGYSVLFLVAVMITSFVLMLAVYKATTVTSFQKG